MTTTPPGWYDDGHGALRWWDGAQWTEHVAQPDPEQSAAPTEAEIVAAQVELAEQQPEAAAAAPVEQPALAPESVAPATPTEFPVYPSTPEPAAQPAAPVEQAYSVAQPAYPAEQGYQPAEQAYPAAQVYPAQQAYPPAQEYAPQQGYPPAQEYAPQQGYPVAGYPQGSYPGSTGGAFVAATEPRKSKLWIVWVVLGVVLLGFVVAAAVLIPLALLNFSTANSGAQSANEQAAVAAVELYDDAWQNSDCDALTGSTTSSFRDANGFTDCADFTVQADDFDASVEDYEVQVTDVETVGDEITVTTNETYSEVIDENGDPIDPVDGAEVYHYTVIKSEGAWVIDDVY